MIFLFQLADVDVRFYGRGGMRASAYDETRYAAVDSILSAITSLVDRLHDNRVVYVRLVEVPPRFKFRDPALTLRRNRGD